MRWSKVRSLVRDSFADSVRDRVDVRVTNADRRGFSGYGSCMAGSISVDGHVVAHIDPHRLRRLTLSLPASGESGAAHEIVLIVQPRPKQAAPQGALVGEFLDFQDACWEYLQSNLNESLSSADPIVSSLAVLNARVGRQRLRRVATRELHLLTRAMLDFRIEAERHARSAQR